MLGLCARCGRTARRASGNSVLLSAIPGPCQALPPPTSTHWRVFETVCRDGEVGGGERGPKPGARAPHLSTPSLPCLGAPPQNAPSPSSSPHHFFHLSNHSSHFKDCRRVLLSSISSAKGCQVSGAHVPLPRKVCGPPVNVLGPQPRICADSTPPSRWAGP